MRIKLIANPAAGRCAPQQIARAKTLLESSGAEVDLFLTAARGDARAAAAAAGNGGYDRIVVAGGDGTLNEVVNGLNSSSLPLAVIPLGTVNVLALEAGIPFNLVRACSVATSGQPRPVAVGRCGDERFLLMAGVGFDAEAVRSVNPRLKRRIGRFAYLVSALRLLLVGYTPQLEVSIDNAAPRPAQTVIVGNGRLYGGRFSLTPGAALADPDFEVLLIERPGRLPLLRTALRMLLGRAVARSDGRLVKARRIDVAGTAALQLDGDAVGTTPTSFSIEPAALILIHPLPGQATP